MKLTIITSNDLHQLSSWNVYLLQNYQKYKDKKITDNEKELVDYYIENKRLKHLGTINGHNNLTTELFYLKALPIVQQLKAEEIHKLQEQLKILKEL